MNRTINSSVTPHPTATLVQRLLPPLALVLLVLAVYAPTLRHHFVYDDQPHVVNNPAVNSPSPELVFADTFPPGRPEHRLYRPLLTLSYALDAALARTPAQHAALAHAHNLLLHLGTCLLLWGVLRHRSPAAGAAGRQDPRGGTGGQECPPSGERGPARRGRGAKSHPSPRSKSHGAWTLLSARQPALYALVPAALFAVHPVLTETVAWISGRSEGLLGLWAVLGLFLAGGFAPGDSSRRLVGRAALLGLVTTAALLTKESALVLPFLWAAAVYLKRDDQLPPRRIAILFAAPMALSVVALGMRFCMSGGLTPDVHVYSGIPTVQRWSVIGMALARYLRLALVPADLNIHWPPLPLAVNTQQAWLGALGTVSLVGAATFGLIRRRAWALGPLWFTGTLFIYSNVVILIGAIFAERFLYLPLMGLAILLTDLLVALPRRTPSLPRQGLMIALATVIGFAAVTSARRSRIWASDVDLWRATYRATPHDAVAAIAYPFYLVKAATPQSLAEARAVWPRIRHTLPVPLTPPLLERVRWINYRLARPTPPVGHPSDPAHLP